MNPYYAPSTVHCEYQQEGKEPYDLIWHCACGRPIATLVSNVNLGLREVDAINRFFFTTGQLRKYVTHKEDRQ